MIFGAKQRSKLPILKYYHLFTSVKKVLFLAVFACLSVFMMAPDLMWEKSWYLLTDGRQFIVQNLNQLYVLVSSAYK